MVSHEAITAPTPTTGTGRTYITELGFDGYGHVNSIKTATEADQTWAKYDLVAEGNLDVISEVHQDATGKVSAAVKTIDLSDYAKKDDLVDAANDGALTFKGETGVISVSGSFSANQATASEVSISLDPAAVTTAKIADTAVTTGKIADDAVTTSKIVNDAVTTAKIVDAAVTDAKLAANAVTAAKIVDAAITSAKIADHSIGAHHTKACKDYAGDDAEVWIFDCGGAV